MVYGIFFENYFISKFPKPKTRSQNNFRQDSMDELCLKEEALKQRDEMVSCLLEELVKVRQGCAESDDLIRSLKAKMEELEEDKKTLRESTPDNSVAHLQDELIASKLREAEASLSLKDLKQRVQELSQQWQRHLQVNYLPPGERRTNGHVVISAHRSFRAGAAPARAAAGVRCR